MLLTIGTLALIVSGIQPADRTIWILVVLPIFIGVPILIATYNRFPLTPLAYWLVLVYALIMMLGGHYEWSQVPLGFWLQDLLDLSRSPYDRLGHFTQGFMPAILVREILLRRSPLVRSKWLVFLVTAVCLAISACYEFTEWWAAVVMGESAEAFLGFRGDIWDTQWDMFLSLIGAVSAQLLLVSWHDRQLDQLVTSSVAGRSAA
ncbi:MAG: DUF2238 domain-containing protein [Candidatus Marinimicrobia bacterium]|nr:DUF2238 domain-containing protein [Candidatus Neomarinimicrobiota bacterium]